MEWFTILSNLTKNCGPWAITILMVFLLLRILLDEDRSSLFRAKFYRVVHSFTGSREQEKKYISNDIKGKLNLARRNMQFGKEVLPRAIDISWVEGGDGSVHDVHEGEFIVKLDPHEHQAKNITLLTCALVKRTTLLGIRHSVEPSLQTAIDFNLVRKLLDSIGKADVLDWFISNEYKPQIAANEKIEFRNKQIITIDERGLFTRLLLIELEQFAREMIGRSPKPYMAGEIEGLVNFLFQLCSKTFGQNVPLQYERAFIRLGVIIVAKTRKILMEGIEPYIKPMQTLLKRHFKSIYILSFDKDWLGEVNQEAQNYIEEQVTNLDKTVKETTVAIKTHDIKYTCLDQDGKRRTSRLMRYISPEVEDNSTMVN